MRVSCEYFDLNIIDRKFCGSKVINNNKFDKMTYDEESKHWTNNFTTTLL